MLDTQKGDTINGERPKNENESKLGRFEMQLPSLSIKFMPEFMSS